MSASPLVRVLLVDADSNRAERLCNMLYAADTVDCIRVTGIDAAEAELRNLCPDVTVFSLSLPQHPGLAALAVLRAVASGVPLIALAEESQETLALKAVQQGAADYLLEPLIYPTVLSRSIRHAIEHTRRRQVEEALLQSEMKYRRLFEESRDAIFMTDLALRIVETNPAMQELVGYSAEELEQMTVEDLYADPADRYHYEQEWRVKGRLTDLEVRLRRSDGTALWCLQSVCERRSGDGTTLGYQCIAHNIDDRKRAEEQLVHNAVHDVLTGLPNRARFTDRLERALLRWQRQRDQLFAVLFLDLDRFKVVNDSLGHAAGDDLLIRVSRVLCECIREQDTVARLGGDEFAVLLEHIETPADAVLVANRIHSCLEAPINISGQAVFTTCSIGIALPHLEQERPDDLLRNADLAMYHAKAEGPSRHAMYAPAMHSAAVTVMQLDMDLRAALQNNEFVLHYQPIYLLRSGRVCGFEALVRWRHPRRGLLMPGDFLGRAEDTGLITQIGRWVIREVCAQMSAWQRLPTTEPPFISVNVSGKQLMEPSFVPEVAELISQFEVEGSRLILELTETSLMQNPEACATAIRKLRELGVRFSIDDFGTGYSSLSYLHRLPINGLKIDRSFINRLHDEQDGRELVSTIVSLAKILGLDAVAEGVETESQVAALRKLNPKYVQGFYYSRPLEQSAALALLAA